MMLMTAYVILITISVLIKHHKVQLLNSQVKVLRKSANGNETELGVTLLDMILISRRKAWVIIHIADSVAKRMSQTLVIILKTSCVHLAKPPIPFLLRQSFKEE